MLISLLRLEVDYTYIQATGQRRIPIKFQEIQTYIQYIFFMCQALLKVRET